MTLSSGLLVVDKPAGLTSFQCVRRVRDILGVARVGHCGTLDPMARGVLVILFGAATRGQDQFLALEKQYWFRAQWGVTTDTGDREGQEIGPRGSPVDRTSRAAACVEALSQAVAVYQGDTAASRRPPTRRLKYKGRHYYDWARQGIEIPRAPRSVTISRFDVLAHAGEFWEARVVCSRGTYIRTLAEDVAKELGSGAHLVELDPRTRRPVSPGRRARLELY